MCLHPQTGKVITLKKDIIVYKRFERTRSGNWVTPFRRARIKFGATIEVRPDWALDSIVWGHVSEGLHAYRSKRFAKQMRNESDEDVFKVVIPKGAKVVYGWYDIVATKMRTYKQVLKKGKFVRLR